ncbi:MAG: hypothetical protein ACM3MA_01300 [Acidobacteriota bacterium]
MLDRLLSPVSSFELGLSRLVDQTTAPKLAQSYSVRVIVSDVACGGDT